MDLSTVRQHTRSEGDTESFTRFAEHVQPKLRTALIAAFGTDVAAEALSEAMEYGWRHWGRIRDMKNPDGYLWAVGRNKGHTVMRGRSRRRRADRSALMPAVPNPSPWVEPGLPAAMAGLSERQRVAVFLLHGHDWPHSEVASFLGVSIPTVQKHAQRGMAKLRKTLGAGI